MTPEKELALLPHYEKHLNYYSPVPAMFQPAMEGLGLWVKFIKHRKHVLDLGCGDGRLLLELARKYNTTGFGIDYSEIRIAKARAEYTRIFGHLYGPPITFQQQSIQVAIKGTVTTLYDFCFMFEVLEHLQNPRAVLDRIKTPIVVGSVPINMPYVAHLQVYETIDDLKTKLHPTKVIELGNHWFCYWTN